MHITTKKSRQRARARAMPAANAFRYTIADVAAMGGPAKTVTYQMLKDGRLERAPDVAGLPTGVTGESLRRLLGISSNENAA
jgi:hypothetical protein